MSEMKFTPSQQDAIDAGGGSIIVSAAAGSGKTRVLVERVIRLLTDKNNPIDADRLLIVTFTKAAAEEMRGRISSAIDELLINEPDNTALRRQQLLLMNADICTIHSFCSRIIRENFYLLDIDQDFRIASEGEKRILKMKILSEFIEEKYKEGDVHFLALCDALSTPSSDSELEKALLEVYESSISHPFPQDWLESSAAFYDPEVPLDKTPFSGILIDAARSAAEYIRFLLNNADEIVYEYLDDFQTKAATCGYNKLMYLKGFTERLELALKDNNREKISECVNSFEKQAYRKPTAKNHQVSDEVCDRLKAYFDAIDDTVNKKLCSYFEITDEEFRSSNEVLYPAVVGICEILGEFDKRYLDAKKERGVLDFSDLEHFLIKLLVKRTENGIEKTDFAKSMSERYDGIMVDEYQDTNDIQECIFRALSKDEKNLFVVGDIKQSIYRFREAVPEIFKQRRKKSMLYDKENPEFPAKIILDKNFRSREGIIDSVNFVFSTIMSESVGDVEYNDDEKLTVGSSYPETDEAETEIHILDTTPKRSENIKDDAEDSEDEEEAKQTEKEAMYIAGLIRRMVDEKKQITDSGKQRDVSYGDFAILMRYLSSNGRIYADILNSLGIPAYIDSSYSLFDCYEVNIALSMLKITDNPLQDIPMLSVLLSPVIGFTPDDLAKLRVDYTRKRLYHSIISCADDKNAEGTVLNKKCKDFLSLFMELRKYSATMNVSSVLEYFFEKTGFKAIFSAMDNGDIRIRNIKKLTGFISDYESGGRRSLTEFVRYTAFLEENGTDISVQDASPVDSVRIMTIHHSKGLEFPVCILAGLSARGNTSKDIIPCHNVLGLGLKRTDARNMIRFNTLQSRAVEYCKSREEQSEEMRVLYVAMTRAKEKLIAVISMSSRKKEPDINSDIRAIVQNVDVSEGAISHYSVENQHNFKEWLLSCAFVHPDMSELRDDIDMDVKTLPTRSRWKYVRAVSSPNVKHEKEKLDEAITDDDILKLIKERCNEKYYAEKRTEIPSKVSASAIAHSKSGYYPIGVIPPSFMREEGLTGAARGTAMHNFLQYADFNKLLSEPENEIMNVRDAGYITDEQAAAISVADVSLFIKSSIFSRIMKADKILREYQFAVYIKASDVSEEYTCDDKVVLQGAMDCIIFEPDGITILDYKTDKERNIKALGKRYEKQLVLYKKAAEQLFEVPVKSCVIYSLTLGEETEIEE